jgi:hypothetical protein
MFQPDLRFSTVTKCKRLAEMLLDCGARGWDIHSTVFHLDFDFAD